jgi:hypothetical protein
LTRALLTLLVTLTLAAPLGLGCRRGPSDVREAKVQRHGLHLTPRAEAQAAPAQPLQPPGRPFNSGTDCFTTAQQSLNLINQTAYSLCLGAGSDGPTQCFAAALDRTNLLDGQIVGLCRCADSPGPVDCFEQARPQAFLTDDQLVAMCSAVVTQQLLPGSCAVRQY